MMITNLYISSTVCIYISLYIQTMSMYTHVIVIVVVHVKQYLYRNYIEQTTSCRSQKCRSTHGSCLSSVAHICCVVVTCNDEIYCSSSSLSNFMRCLTQLTGSSDAKYLAFPLGLIQALSTKVLVFATTAETRDCNLCFVSMICNIPSNKITSIYLS